ncbi:hypothetical protein GGU11DRAFT_740353 [Lentinula aff. detonsa]|nr:hypothetical protein GGU11DRAFT_740353 [Lentinula aff. detonsa]
MFLHNTLLLSLPLIVSAYPITVLNSSSSATTFVVLLALALSVTVLVVTKFLYMRYRRTHIAYNFSDCSLQTSQQSATSFFYNSEKLAKPSKTAFLVGFFGSPSWETSVKTLYDGPSIYCNQLQFQSRRSQNNGRRTSRFSISEFGGLGRSVRYSDTTDSRAFSNTLVATSHPSPPSYASLPVYPADARINSSSRRHSLPVTRQVDSEHTNDRRSRHSSLKSSRSRRSDLLPTPGLRLVNLVNNNTDALSHQTSFLDFELFSPNPSSMRSRSRSKSNRTCVPPLPPLPASVLLSPLPDLPELSISAEGRSHISSPYALSSKIKSNSPSEANLSPVLPDSDQATTMTRRPSQNSTTFPRIKAQPNRSPSVRSRKSPIVGPSPLRIVTLPEGSVANMNKDTDKDHLPTIPSLASTTGSTSAPTTQVEESKKHQNYFDLGIGYPSSWGLGLGLEDDRTSQIQSEVRSASRQRLSQATSIHSPLPSSPNMDAMLGIIQELVEETSQWDDSLFMEDSFKALIENSQSTSSGSPLSSSKSSRHSRQSSVPVEEEIPPIPSPRISVDSAKSGTRSFSSDASTKSKALSPTSQLAPGNPTKPTSPRTVSGAERKPSPKSILKRTLMMPSRSVEFELGLVELDAVKMESFRMSAYESPKFYGDGYDEPSVRHIMPGAYEHGSVLTPLHESDEEQVQEDGQAHNVQRLVVFDVKRSGFGAC